MTTRSPVDRRTFRRALLASGDLDPATLHSLWSDPDSVVHRGSVLKEGDRCTVVRVESSSGALVLKRYNARNLAHTAIHLFLRSRARWNWRNADRLGEAGLLTPRPLAMVEERLGPLRRESYLLAEFVEGRPMNEWAEANRNDAGAVEEVAAAFGDVWRTLGERRLAHGDMKATNFLVDQRRRIWLIDLDGMRRHPPGPTLARARRRDLERFLRNWRDLPAVAAIFRSRLDTRAGPSG